ncbi:hypothetical protein PI125_g23143 [Phytophthora idaei]|nr:hypothetical protein PI125_g23143 [Phytophthora idaei]
MVRASKSKSPLPATQMKAGANREPNRSAARTLPPKATIGERSVSFGELDDEDSRAVDASNGSED